jgi:DNA polymerase III, delta subunit
LELSDRDARPACRENSGFSRPFAYWAHPTCFGRLVGKEVAVRYLSDRLRRGEPRHIILDGRDGSGRATTARIYARGLHCASAGPDGLPCNSCEACQTCIRGSFIDAIESSAPDWSDAHEAVQSARAAATTPPWLGGWRTILIRSAEVVPAAAWDVLLKTIERPNYEQVFIFTTAQLAKIPEPVRSRCHTLRIELLAPALEVEWLGQIASVEGIPCEPAALRLVAYVSEGRPRRLLDNFDRVRRAGKVTIEGARAYLELTDTDRLARVWQATLSHDPGAAAEALSGWPVAPLLALDKLREVLLFLLGRWVEGRLDGFDPMFVHCADDVAQIDSAVSRWGEAVGLSRTEAVLVILEQLSNVSAATLPELERTLINLAERLRTPPATPWRGFLPVAGSYAPQLGWPGYTPVSELRSASKRLARRKHRVTNKSQRKIGP